MKDLLSKTLTIVALVVFVFSFFNFNFFAIGEGYGITGEALLKFMDSDGAPVWPVLFVLFPILIGLIRLGINVDSVSMRVIAIINAGALIIPFIAMLVDIDGIGSKFGGGFILCFFCWLAILFLAISTEINEVDGKKKIEEIKEEGSRFINVRQTYNETKMREIIANPSLYNDSLVTACQRELDIRKNAETIMQDVFAYPDEKINEILAASDTYSESLVYCCEIVRRKREEERKQIEAQKREEEQQRLQREEHERRLRRAAWWKKHRIYFYIAFVVLLIVIITLYLHSDGRQYAKGISLYEEGNYTEAVEWLEKVDESYKDAPRANWLLYNYYNKQGDKTKAARALAKSTVNNNWYDLPEAYAEYSKHLMSGFYAPEIPINELKAASLMETATDDEYLQETAGELYFKNQQWNKAYSLIADHAATTNTNELERRANAYYGTFFLFGLAGVEKDVEKAAKYYSYASYEQGLVEFMMIARLAMHSKERNGNFNMIHAIANIAENVDEENLSSMGRVFAHTAKNYVQAKQRHSSGSELWPSYDQYWQTYYYDNGKGAYTGEYSGSLCGDGGAQGWGSFVHQSDYHYASLGKYKYISSKCLLNGEGVIINYYDSGRIVLSYGNWEDGNLKGENWNNDEMDTTCLSSLVIHFPF